MEVAREAEAQFLDDEHPMVAHLANRMASMEPADRSILRATPAWKLRNRMSTLYTFWDSIMILSVHFLVLMNSATIRKVLQSFGAAFRRTDVDLYEWSFPVGSIQVFWSHSWHGDKYMKSLLLLLLYNGPAAAIAATISALLMMCLQIAGFLPGLRRVGKSALDQGVTMEFGPWCTATAGLVFLVVLLLGSPGA